MLDRLDMLETRLDVLDRMLMDPDIVGNSKKLREASQERAQVGEVVDAWHAHKALEAELAGARDMLGESDASLREMAREEIGRLEKEIEASKEAIKLLLLPKDPYEGRPLMLEIRAGTGGDEAALFAGDLLRMYIRYGERHGLRFEVVSASPVAVGGSGKLEGFKEIVLSATGDQAYNLLRFESGGHRVQRVPATETQGRIHTSAATVAVLPEPDEIEIHLEDKDLDIQVFRAGGPGGQSVNTTDSAVRIVHLPTGLTVQCQDEKSQIKNRASALRVLKARLLQIEVDKQAAAGNAARRAQVGSGDRSERIRTYNFPQNRITDHRVGVTLYNLDRVVEGDLDELHNALLADYRAQLLSNDAPS